MSDLTKRDWLKFFGVMALLVIIAVGVTSARRSARSSAETAKKVEQLFKERTAETDRRRAADLARQEQDRQVLEALKTTVDGMVAVQGQLTDLLTEVRSCTTPDGECAKRGQAQLLSIVTALRTQNTMLFEQIRRLEFRVSGTVQSSNGQAPVPFQGTAKAQDQPCIGVGNVGVLPGVITCAQPEP